MSRTVRDCTKADLRPLLEEQPSLTEIFRFLLDKREYLSVKEIAEGAGLSVEEARDALDFLEQRCREGGFENPLLGR